MPQIKNPSGFDRDTRSFANQPPPAPPPAVRDVRADLKRLLSVETPAPAREVTRLSAEQINEVQRRLAGLPPGTISSVKRIRENSRQLRDRGITQIDLSELFDYLNQTGAIEWLASDPRDFRYLGGL